MLASKPSTVNPLSPYKLRLPHGLFLFYFFIFYFLFLFLFFEVSSPFHPHVVTSYARTWPALGFFFFFFSFSFLYVPFVLVLNWSSSRPRLKL